MAINIFTLSMSREKTLLRVVLPFSSMFIPYRLSIFYTFDQQEFAEAKAYKKTRKDLLLLDVSGSS